MSEVVTELKTLQNNMTNMQAEMNEVKAKEIDRMKKLSTEYEDISDEESNEEAEINEDPLAALDKIANSEEAGTSKDEDNLLEELKKFFDSEEVTGPKICEKVGSLLNASLRKHPAAERVKKVAEAMKYPENVPNLKVPKTNEELLTCLSYKGKYLDTSVSKVSMLISKALCPLLNITSDASNKSLKTVGEYMEGFNQSIRLLVASFNYLCQIRKDIIKHNTTIPHMAFMCKPEHGTGEEFLFPFELIKKVQEMNKMNKIGKPKFQQSFKGKFFKKKNYQNSGKNSFLGFRRNDNNSRGRGRGQRRQ